MIENTFIKKIKLSIIFISLFIVVTSCSFLIVVNYLTIKILSGSRAYINGESHYSKAQKDATLHLTTYLFNADPSEWESFNLEVSVPQGDQIARLALNNHEAVANIELGFKAGRNDPQDFDDLIWLFKNFKSIPFFAKAITEWEQGDELISQLVVIGDELNQKIKENKLTNEDKSLFLKKINSIAVKLTVSENKFSQTLSSGARTVKDYLLLLDIFFTLIIIGSVSGYYAVMVNRLTKAKQEADELNKNLTTANKELDKFVYSASHDLRSPISSLKGLIEIMNTEDDMEQIRTYLALMNESLDKQDHFIKDIINYSRNRKEKINITSVSLNTIIDEAFAQNKFRTETSLINITKNLSIDTIYSDELKLQIIINNLYSNAIKYSDSKKDNSFITIHAYEDQNNYKIDIEDNGLGINPEYHTRIFEMFFVTNNQNKGSGLGLYLVKEAIENLNGSVIVTSAINIGSKFSITLPKKYETKQ